MEEDYQERKEAELEFVTSAYEAEEAWIEETEGNQTMVHRRLTLLQPDGGSSEGNNNTATIQLSLHLPQKYPSDGVIQISGNVDGGTSQGGDLVLRKAAYEALPLLVKCAQEVADDLGGDEAIFLIFSRADEWIQGDWPALYNEMHRHSHSVEENLVPNKSEGPVILGRRLIYSHHIISKVKRADIKKLAQEYKLTGYMKIGWPGLLIIEGFEEHCVAFYDEIRPWSWQYLVVRGEQQETYSPPKESTTSEGIIESNRKFKTFQEVEDMSTVAKQCREVGLEALFKSSMKVYDNSSENSEGEMSFGGTGTYGVLVLVDHMNDGKGYRKWLRRTAKDTDCRLLIKLSYPKDDYSKRPVILVGIIGDSQSRVGAFMKRWRTSRVDVDSKGKACLERQMKVLVEGRTGTVDDSSIDWAKAMAEDSVTVTQEHLVNLLQSVGGSEWTDAIEL